MHVALSTFCIMFLQGNSLVSFAAKRMLALERVNIEFPVKRSSLRALVTRCLAIKYFSVNLSGVEGFSDFLFDKLSLLELRLYVSFDPIKVGISRARAACTNRSVQQLNFVAHARVAILRRGSKMPITLNSLSNGQIRPAKPSSPCGI